MPICSTTDLDGVADRLGHGDPDLLRTHCVPDGSSDGSLGRWIIGL